jgi:hypothetical protein
VDRDGLESADLDAAVAAVAGAVQFGEGAPGRRFKRSSRVSRLALTTNSRNHVTNETDSQDDGALPHGQTENRHEMLPWRSYATWLENAGMSQRSGTNWRRIVILVAVFLLGVGATGLGVLFAQQGLQRADQLASVIGVFIALAGLAVAVYSAWLARVATLTTTQATPPDGPKAPSIRFRRARNVQNIIAEGPDSRAQGALDGDIYNYGSVRKTPLSGAANPDDQSEAEDSQR